MKRTGGKFSCASSRWWRVEQVGGTSVGSIQGLRFVRPYSGPRAAARQLRRMGDDLKTVAVCLLLSAMVMLGVYLVPEGIKFAQQVKEVNYKMVERCDAVVQGGN